MGYPCPFIPAYDVYSIGIVMAELILGSLNLDQTRKRNERINVFQRYIKNEETVIIDGWTQLERDVDKCITWNSKSLQLVCEIAVKCMAPSPDDRLRTSDFLPLLSKAINLQAGLHDFEPAGAGDGPPCAATAKCDEHVDSATRKGPRARVLAQSGLACWSIVGARCAHSDDRRGFVGVRGRLVGAPAGVFDIADVEQFACRRLVGVRASVSDLAHV